MACLNVAIFIDIEADDVFRLLFLLLLIRCDSKTSKLVLIALESFTSLFV